MNEDDPDELYETLRTTRFFERAKSNALISRINHLIKHASVSEPLTYREAMSRPDAKQWEITMKEEIKSQMENST